MGCVAVVQDQDQVAHVKTKLLKLKLWKAEVTDHALTTNAACSVLRLTSNRYCVPAAMARTKRKWTREAIEEALLQNTRVNATPAEPEDAAAKRKRQQRRSNKKRNLTKELNALSVTGTDTAAPQAVPVIQAQPMLQDQTTLEQEGKQEEDDPADHQRRFAVAYVEGQRRAVVEADEQVLSPSLVERSTAKRTRNAERQRIRRANMTYSQTERRRAIDRERQRARRAQLTGSQRAATRMVDRQRRQDRRERQNSAERAQAQHEDQNRRAEVRAEQTDQERDVQRQQNRVRRKAPQRCRGHVNHEDFRASMVTGKDVVDGRHRLPPTTMFPLCQAWKWPAESDFICCLKGRVQLPPLQPAPPRLLQLYGDKEFRRHIRAYNQAFAFTSIGASSSDNTFRDVNQDQSVAGQHGVYTYRIQGAMGHFMGSMLPYVDRRTGERVPPKFAQIYIVDPDMQERANRRKL
ncbi:unnamed protein product [Phytophthora fragariaefolia]|uniref:Unnamed protein product n=1 Tax=Phytophthora fragariaefolia TaxID=1490495 RepID=A0A9W6XGA3_9STRA|nr:unnamed protein product [Phytophthora fragariaefolia]